MFAFGKLTAGLLDLTRQRANDGSRKLILNSEYFLKFAVIALAPEVIAVCSVDELYRYPYAFPRFANAALDSISNAEVAADFANIGCPATQREGRIAGDNEQRSEARQLGNDVFGNSIGKVVLSGIAA